MNKDVEGLALEHMWAIRMDLGRMADDIQTMHADMVAVRQQLAGVIARQTHHHNDIAALEARVDRVERRLGLID